jgi:hypothetical protein
MRFSTGTAVGDDAGGIILVILRIIVFQDHNMNNNFQEEDYALLQVFFVKELSLLCFESIVQN